MPPLRHTPPLGCCAHHCRYWHRRTRKSEQSNTDYAPPLACSDAAPCALMIPLSAAFTYFLPFVFHAAYFWEDMSAWRLVYYILNTVFSVIILMGGVYSTLSDLIGESGGAPYNFWSFSQPFISPSARRRDSFGQFYQPGKSITLTGRGQVWYPPNPPHWWRYRLGLQANAVNLPLQDCTEIGFMEGSCHLEYSYAPMSPEDPCFISGIK
eukprot:4798458-Pyramimonas_sp.AAC.1